ncbi:MAG: hypothetical protein ACYTBZ_06635 [Planctomycetota bacterium]
MKQNLIIVTLAGWLIMMGNSSKADLLRYADYLKDYSPGMNWQAGYDDPDKALGQPSTLHTPEIADNGNVEIGEQTVVSLGQLGSITLGFNKPVLNRPTSPQNPDGYDLLIWGNTFQGGSAITPEFEYGRFQEQGFVEVAQADAQGEPIEWYLILSRIFYDSVRGETVPRDFTPDELLPPTLGPSGEFLASGDLSISASLFDGFADSVPAQGAVLATIISGNDLADVVLDDPETFDIEGLGGASIDLGRAVLQTSPGIPAMNGQQFQFVDLDYIDLLRITDARNGDLHPGPLGPINTEVDGIIVLPCMNDCNDPFADADGDNDVDQEDYGLWQLCISGEGNGITNNRCCCFDRDHDGDIDTSDYNAFETCATTSGANIPADPNCDGSQP